jgi:spore coat protein U-like protein
VPVVNLETTDKREDLFMKKMLFAGVAIAAAATPAFAQSSPTLTYNLEAEVSTICGVYSETGQASRDIDFGDLAATPVSTQLEIAGQPGERVTYRCNSPAGFTRTIESANSGVMVRTGSNGDALNSIGFEMSHPTGGSGTSFAYQSLTTPRVDTFPGTAPFLVGRTGNINFRVNGVGDVDPQNRSVGTTVFAGDYTDVVTITVTSL